MKEMSYYEGLMHSYALGCISKDELDELHEYFSEYAEYPWGELGEFQNLSALLPSILNIEVLSPKLKDKVARKLYRLREEARNNRVPDEFPMPKAVTEEIPPVTEESAPPKNSFINQIVNPSPKEEVFDTDLPLPDEYFEEEMEIITPPNKEDEVIYESPSPVRPLFDEKIELDNYIQPEDNLSYNEVLPEQDTEETVESDEPAGSKREVVNDEYLYEEPQKKSLTGYLLGFLLFFLVSAGVIFLYFKMTNDFKAMEEGNVQLKKSFDSLALTVNFNRELQDILEAPTTKIVVLKDLANNSAFGKVFISVEEQRSVLFLRDLPKIEENEYFTLWTDNMNLGAVKMNDKVQYHIVQTPIKPENIRQFILTVEDSEKAEKPGGRVLLRSEDPVR